MKTQKGVYKCGRYVGIYSGGQLPCGTIYKELDRVETFRGKEVKYYHVWVKEREIKPLFNESKEPDRQKINLLTRFFREFWEDE